MFPWASLRCGGGRGGGQGAQNLAPPVPYSPASRTFISRLPPFSVLLPSRDLRSPARLTLLQFDSLRDTLMPLDILLPVRRNHCKQIYYFAGSKSVFQPKRKFSFARLLGSLNSDCEDVKCESNTIWVDVFESILTHC